VCDEERLIAKVVATVDEAGGSPIGGEDERTRLSLLTATRCRCYCAVVGLSRAVRLPRVLLSSGMRGVISRVILGS
jgi:hypothetical protein